MILIENTYATPMKKIPPVMRRKRGSIMEGFKINHITNATKLPTVPGANGDFPTYRTVPIISANLSFIIV